MPISKIKSNAINDDAITTAKLVDNAVTLGKTNNLFVNTEISGTEAARMPVGTTAQRANAHVGDLRHNTNLGILEQYTTDGWQGIASSPTVISVSPNNIEESDSTQTVVITGQNFDVNATAVLIGSGGNITPTTSTRNSSSQITIVYSGSDVITSNTGPYDVKVTNGTGLAGTLDDAITLDAAPNWTTAAGNIATVTEDTAMSTATVAATDPEGGSVTYSVTSGSLPSGLSLNASNGQITGTPNVNDTVTSATVTHNFSITANDGTGNTTARAFNIIRNQKVGYASAHPATTIASMYAQNMANGMVWIQNSNLNSGNPFQMRYASHDGRGWLETLWSSDSGNGTPWTHWLNKGGSNYTRPQMYAYNQSSYGLNYSSGDSSFTKLHNSMGLVDFAVTSKSAVAGNGLTATGANQNSAYPLIASNHLSGSQSSACRLALTAYFGGYGEGFSSGSGAGDHNAVWQPSAGGPYEIHLSYRDGNQTLGEWHIADGFTSAGTTYAPNVGYRNDTGGAYDGANVGSWASSNTTKSSTYTIDSSNVLSCWVSDAL